MCPSIHFHQIRFTKKQYPLSMGQINYKGVKHSAGIVALPEKEDPIHKELYA